MKPTDIQEIGNQIAIKWDDGAESFIPLALLRQRCPCAGCQGETDIMGNLYKGPSQKLAPNAFELKGIFNVGGYAIQPVWLDAHASGIYTFDYLKKLASTE